MPFAALGLKPALIRALHDSGYEKPTPIQELAIPLVLAGHDLLAGAQTGTGKTADWIVDLGPEGGVRGGQIIATGTPEQVAANAHSFTGQFLARMLNPPAPIAAKPVKRTKIKS